MKAIKILQKKQENGLWGMPFNCFKMSDVMIPSKYEVLNSAIVAAVNEKYNRPFEIFMMSDEGFAIQIYTNTYPEKTEMFYLRYSEYEIIDDTLYEFRSSNITNENEKEHLLFLREKKLKQLENIF